MMSVGPILIVAMFMLFAIAAFQTGRAVLAFAGML